MSPQPQVCKLDVGTVKLQKMYKSYGTWQKLADCTVVIEEMWWKALHFVGAD